MTPTHWHAIGDTELAHIIETTQDDQRREEAENERDKRRALAGGSHKSLFTQQDE